MESVATRLLGGSGGGSDARVREQWDRLANDDGQMTILDLWVLFDDIANWNSKSATKQRLDAATAAPKWVERAAALSPVQAALTVVFALEVLAKGAVLPWREFWRRRRNRFDVAVTLATALVTLLVVLPNGFDNQAAIRAVLSLRLLRLLAQVCDLERSFQRTYELRDAPDLVDAVDLVA